LVNFDQIFGLSFNVEDALLGFDGLALAQIQ
jgi:hypothetical protein